MLERSRSLVLFLLPVLSVPAGCDARRTASSIPTATATASASATETASASAPASAAPASASAAGPEVGVHGKILCFGDSITQADWPGKIAPEEKWVAQLGAKSDRITAVNAGKGGRTTTTGLAELDKVLDANLDSAAVLLFLGVNDMKHARPGAVEKATSNMGQMVDRVRAKLPRAEVWIMAPIGINPDRLSPYFKDQEMGPDTVHYMKALSVAYEALARKKGTRFINLLHAVAPADIEDGVHANARGQRAIADAVWSGLQR